MMGPSFGSIFASDQSRDDEVALVPNADDHVEPDAGRLRVLVVDDQKLIADTLAEILCDSGFDAVPAHDGWSALEIAARFHPDWVISDVLMPRMNGVELAITLRQAYPRTRVLLFSGQAGISEILEAGKARGYEFEILGKPVHPFKLMERLKQM